MKIQFSWLGVIVFVLPMIINLVYFVVADKKEAETTQATYQWLERIEQATRILYMLAISFLVSRQKIELKSPWLLAAIIFLVFYYMMWIRYFVGGMENSLLRKSFLFVPIPLAVFPVLYFLSAAMWLHNYVAFGCMVIFGIAHYAISYINLR